MTTHSAELATTTLALAILVGAAGGGVSGLLGVGGAAILSPLLQLLLGCDQHTAQGISLAVILPPVGIPALLAYWRAGIKPDWRTVVELAAGFIAMAYAGGRFAQWLPERPLKALFITFLLVAGFRSYRAARRAPEPAAVAAALPIAAARAPLGTALAIGACAGFAAGVLGIGGGVILVPALRRFAGMSRLHAQAASLAMMVPPVGLPAVLVYATSIGFSWRLIALLVTGFVGGAYAGGRVSTRIAPSTAATVFSVLLFGLAAMLLLRF